MSTSQSALEEALARLSGDPPDFAEFEAQLAILRATKDWPEIDRWMRRALLAIVRSPTRTASLESFEFEMWRGLATVYIDGLKDDARAVAALRRAISLRPEATDLALELARSHARMGDTAAEIEALRKAAAGSGAPEVWRRLLDLQRARGETHATWAPLSFLARGGHATANESAELSALQAMPVTSPLDTDGWSLLIGTQEEVEAMELVDIVAPLLRQVARVAALPPKMEPWALVALGIDGGQSTPAPDSASRFRAGLSAVAAHPGMAAARELGLSTKPKALLFACFKLCGAKEPIPIDVRLDAIAIAIDLRPLVTPAILEKLSSVVRTLKRRGTVTLTWFEMAERTALRAGLLLSGNLGAAEAHLDGKRPRELAELLEFAASPAHGELRRLIYGGIQPRDARAESTDDPKATAPRLATSTPLVHLDAMATRLRQRSSAHTDVSDREADELLTQIVRMLGARARIPGLLTKRVTEDCVTLSRDGRLGRIEIRWSSEERTMHVVGPGNRHAFRWDPAATAFLDPEGRSLLTALDEALDTLFAG